MNKNKTEYTHLLSTIYLNATRIREVAVLILKESLEKKDQEEKLTLVSSSENFLFAFLDEIGKFYLIKKQYPKKLSEINLREIGFRNHDKKLEVLAEIVKQRQEKRGAVSPFTIEQTVNMLRNFKDTTLHVDYKDGKIITPANSKTLAPDIFNNYVILIRQLVEMTEIDLSIFKGSKK